MVEREYIIEKARVNYEGPFDLTALSYLFREFAKNKQYVLSENRHTEGITGFHEYIISMTKKLTDYARSEIDIRIQIRDAKEKIAEIGNKRKKIMEGHVAMIFDGIVATDYEARWEGKPLFFFLKNLFERYVFTPIAAAWKKQVRDETTHLIDNVKAFFNMRKL